MPAFPSHPLLTTFTRVIETIVIIRVTQIVLIEFLVCIRFAFLLIFFNLSELNLI
jgi:hypothetical protein